MTPLVTIKTRTMIVYRWEGRTEWLREDEAQFLIERDEKRKRRVIAYIVRCRPRKRN